MPTTDEHILRHYSHGSLDEVITAGLDEMRALSSSSPIDLLAGVDEFHIGGRPATKELAERLRIDSDHQVLDVGCGLGGTSRHLASTYGCRVYGVDLTPEYVAVGNQLNRTLGLDGQIELTVASATKMPFGDARFDRASMLHVGMNIADKPALMAEIGRVMKSEGCFVVYDVMRVSDGPLGYPVAWATDESTSFLGSVDDYTDALEGAGFEVVAVSEKRDVALSFFEAIEARLAQGGPPPLGLHLLMGSDAKVKIGHMHEGVRDGAIAPVEVLARRR